MKPMRRSDRAIGRSAALKILAGGEYGVLSTSGPDGRPYGVPVNYVLRDDSIYFHCAISGHKLDNIEFNPRVSFCVVGNTELLPSEFATKYESTVVFGTATEGPEDERAGARMMLVEKYSPDFFEEGEEYISRESQMTRVFRIQIQHISGKARP